MTPSSPSYPSSPDAGTPIITASVPANFLLFGEYAVLEEGGLGLAVAPDVRAHGSLAVAESLTITGRGPRETFVWPGDATFLGDLVDALRAYEADFPARIDIDTSAFFAPDGRKRGFGSSAAVAVLLATLWIAGRRSMRRESSASDRARPEPIDAATVMSAALSAHRAAQGGRGSGYDVAVSTLGGIVLFEGGKAPQARRVELPWLPALRLVHGSTPVVTRGSVSRYLEWRADDPRAAARFVERSSDLVRSFIMAHSWDQARSIAESARDLGVWLGERIGVPARIESPLAAEEDPRDDGRDLDVALVKACGAGNELGVAFLDSPADDALTIATQGVVWE